MSGTTTAGTATAGTATAGTATAGTTTVDPRVLRTRAHVLATARELLAEHGPARLTFSEVSAAARVSRQTLYRYWATPEALAADLLRHGVPTGDGAARPAGDVIGVLTDHLLTLRATLADPATSAACSLLVAAADRCPRSAAALATVLDARRRLLNDRLADLGAALDEDRYRLLVGPVVATHLVARGAVTDAFVALVARTALAAG